MKIQAEEILIRKWYVKEVVLFRRGKALILTGLSSWTEVKYRGLSRPRKKYEGAAVLKLHSMDRERRELKLVLCKENSSIKRLRQLKYLDVIEFKVPRGPIKCDLGRELCTHLELKT